MKINHVVWVAGLGALAGCAAVEHPSTQSHVPVDGQVIARQHAMLAQNTSTKGFGPQSPRDIDSGAGTNSRAHSAAPASNRMNLCNVHFHKNAEHKGEEFSKHAGHGDGQGNEAGYLYSGQLSPSELQPVDGQICAGKQGGLATGDTIEAHYVYSSAQVKPGPTLGACLSDAIKNPQLRVETQVYVLVNDKNAQDFGHLTRHELQNGVHQAVNIPADTGDPVQYAGSTTGPTYNEIGSPFQVTWSVRPKVAKVNIASVGAWCQGNVFKEDHAHGVRNLVVHPDLLSAIER